MRPKSNLILMVVLLLAFGAIYSGHVGRTIWYDEAITYFRYAQNPFIALLFYETPNNHLLHSLLVWLSVTLVGDSVMGLRLPAFFAAWVTLALVYRLGKQISGRAAVGILAAAVLGGATAFVTFVPYARGYTLVMALTLALLSGIYGKASTLTPFHRRMIFGFSFLLILTLPTMLLLTAALVGWSFFERRGTSWRHWLENYALPLGMGAVCAIPFYGYALVSPFMRGLPQGNVSYEAVQEFQALYGAIGAIVLLGGGVGCALLPRFRRLSGWLIGVAGGLLLFQSIFMERTLFIRNFGYLLPIFALGAGILLHKILRQTVLLWGAVVLLVILGAWNSRDLSAPTAIDHFYAVLATHLQPTDVLVVNCCLDIPTQYHYRADLSLFRLTEDKQRLILIPTPPLNPIETLLKTYNLPLDFLAQCVPDQWADFALYVCPVPR